MVHAKLLSATQNPLGLLKTAAGECYQKEATDKVIDHIVKAGHLSVLEHCYANFEVTCSITTLMPSTPTAYAMLSGANQTCEYVYSISAVLPAAR